MTRLHYLMREVGYGKCEATRRRAWIRESDKVLDDVRQRMGI